MLFLLCLPALLMGAQALPAPEISPDVTPIYANLTKRALPVLHGDWPADKRAHIEKGLEDLHTIINFVADQNLHSDHYKKIVEAYFPATDTHRDPVAQVTKFFRSMRRFINAKEHDELNPNPLNDIPTEVRTPGNLNQIEVIYDRGLGFTEVAEARNIKAKMEKDKPHTIAVGDTLWLVVNHKWNLGDISCNDIGDSPSHRMYPIAGYLLHEVIHFRNVANLAFGGGHDIDDQEGNVPKIPKIDIPNFKVTSKWWPAYGPWQARRLASIPEKHPLAWQNVDNYTAFAMELYWYNHCRTNAPHNGEQFRAPTKSDWPLNCVKGIKQATCIII